MTKPIIRIHNLESDKIIDREMTDSEYEIYQKKIAKYEKQQAEAEAKEAARQVILSRLGITEEEARILLGGN